LERKRALCAAFVEPAQGVRGLGRPSASQGDASAAPCQRGLVGLGDLLQVLIQRPAQPRELAVAAFQVEGQGFGVRAHAWTTSRVTISPFSVLAMAWVMR